ncbi:MULTISPECIES: sodium/solute symporter [unclassified Lentimicrobium]|uniref:sodium:solute symporter family transporter n=1 Tax=unclassified Lentimicrobium TaxID=2677434 RepID=UPI0015561E65|nr:MULTISPECIES: sodium/solute symporter [unclassified Lentimicrobium]NPD46259.1 sodium/solute symporter [Lentimicrobium sp. S6]NPD83973.1 sodium/solute symporter [Lentimicrobium sp. L6]
MNWLDYVIILVYFAGFLGMGYFFKENKNSTDYFLGGKSLGWLPLSLSTMATQLSAISFVSAPAFVALKAGGGMKWLTFEFSVPLAMFFLMVVLVPPLFRSGVVSIYEFVERRFDASTRMILSVVFQISRALSTGVMVYTIAIILQAVLDIDFIYTIPLISIVTIIYSWQGGMKAVVWGDAIQMVILFGGLVIALVYGYFLMADSGGSLSSVDPERLQVINNNFGFGDGEYGIWPMIIGGFFLYASYYGTDQTQAQRLLSAKDEKTIRQLLFANGVLRFPVVLIYCSLGLVLGGFILVAPEFVDQLAVVTQRYFPAEYASSGIKPDLMVPVFIVNYLPHGLIGILMVGILSAAMSSLSSTVNSLSAVTVEDFFNRGKKKLSGVKYMMVSKGAVVFWGAVCIASAFLLGGSESSVIEIINAIGSVFYGPVLATFLLAIYSKKVNKYGMNAGIILSVLINLVFSKTMQQIFGFDPGIDIFWIWLNFTGFAMCVIIAYVVSYIRKDPNNKTSQVNYKIRKEDFFSKEGIMLIVFFMVIFVFSLFVPQIFG